MPERRARRRWREPRPLGGAIDRLRASLAPPNLLAQVQDRWAAAVGERVAREATPVRERAGVVTIACRSATWASELSMLSPRLLETLNEALSEGAVVRQLRFVVEPL